MQNHTILNGYQTCIGQLDSQERTLSEVAGRYPHVTDEILRKFSEKFHLSCEASEDMSWPSLDDVSNTSDKAILNLWIQLIQQTTRCNAFSPEAEAMAIKIVRPIPPFPDPVIHVFVDHPTFQAVLLKNQPVARGGIRWSDRKDFFKECFHLMQTQILKNVIIVPSGAKGAFFLKSPSESLKDRRAQALTAYRLFVKAILDLSDTWQEGHIIPPSHSQIHDGPDFYNVIAADKGTATFSDEANTIALERGYWLGDAFASGGSQGYNHKALGITSRGVWISVRHHFQGEIFSQDRPMTVVGVGDMAGDIFGNGMLQEKNMQLVAAFNHDHIFIDPTPDPVKSYNERRRLFDLPHSSWKDYQAFSQGGGVFSRTDSLLALSPEALKLLDLDASEATPNRVIQTILKLPVDLLWMGGIGTFVQGENEENVDDQQNRPLRVFGKDLRARVVGEGANLGFTQQGRIEYAAKGGRINIDALDNSAGVNCSDHEVNIKILLQLAIQKGRLTPKNESAWRDSAAAAVRGDFVLDPLAMFLDRTIQNNLSSASYDERAALLKTITDDVCDLVLTENHWQNIVVSLSQQQDHSDFAPLMDLLIEKDPSKKHLFHRTQERLQKEHKITRPEIVVLSAHSGLLLKSLLSPSSGIHLSNDQDVLDYFPPLLQEKFHDLIPQHLLYPYIKQSIMTNSLMHLCGPTMIWRLAHKYSAPLHTVISHALTFYETMDGSDFHKKLQSYLKNPEHIYPLISLYQDLMEKALEQCFHQKESFESVLKTLDNTKDTKEMITEYRHHISTP